MQREPSVVAGIHHDGSTQYVSNLYPALGETIRVRLRAAPTDQIERVLLRTAPDGEQHLVAMEQDATTGACRWWSVALPVRMPVTHYRFVLLTDDGLLHYNGGGVVRYAPTDRHDFRIVVGYHAPQWVQRSVFYQIFPDRFADGDPDNNVRLDTWPYSGQAPVARRWDDTHGAIADGTRFVEVLSGAEAIVRDGCLPLPMMTQGGSIWRSVDHGGAETGR